MLLRGTVLVLPFYHIISRPRHLPPFLLPFTSSPSLTVRPLITSPISFPFIDSVSLANLILFPYLLAPVHAHVHTRRSPPEIGIATAATMLLLSR